MQRGFIIKRECDWSVTTTMYFYPSTLKHLTRYGPDLTKKHVQVALQKAETTEIGVGPLTYEKLPVGMPTPKLPTAVQDQHPFTSRAICERSQRQSVARIHFICTHHR